MKLYHECIDRPHLPCPACIRAELQELTTYPNTPGAPFGPVEESEMEMERRTRGQRLSY